MSRQKLRVICSLFETYGEKNQTNGCSYVSTLNFRQHKVVAYTVYVHTNEYSSRVNGDGQGHVALLGS